jgi:hypothetical protein
MAESLPSYEVVAFAEEIVEDNRRHTALDAIQ